MRLRIAPLYYPLNIQIRNQNSIHSRIADKLAGPNLYQQSINICFPMPSYTKVYLRNKKESNISIPLRYSFLHSIFVDNMSVKNAALKWKIHYSSAKIIARNAKKDPNFKFFEKYSPRPISTKRCLWKYINDVSSQVKELSSQKESGNDQGGESQTGSSGYSYNKIQIFSTTGWNFLQANPEWAN